MPLEHDVIAAINDELMRIQAHESKAQRHLIKVADSGDGKATLLESTHGRDFYWLGASAEILERLRKLPDNGGAEAIRSEFS